MDHGPTYIIGSSGSGVPAWAVAILAAVLTGATSFVVNVWVEQYRRHQATQTLAATLHSEVATLVTLAKRLSLIDRYRSLLGVLKRLEREAKSFDLPPDNLEFPTPIYDKTADRLGLLGPSLAPEVVEFYNVLYGFRSTVRTVTSEGPHSVASRIAMLTFVLDTVGEALPRADTLVIRLAARAASPWRPWPMSAILAASS